MKRKIVSLLLAISVFATMTTSVAAATIHLTSDDIRQEYLNDPEFYKYFLEYPNEANAVMNDAIEALSRPVSEVPTGTRAGNPETTHAWVNTTLIKQPNGYYCGPTSALMAVIGWGGQSNVAGNTNNEKIETIARMLGTTSSGTVPARIAVKLNEILGTNTPYQYTAFVHTTLTELQFRVYIFNSLAKDRAPIIHVRRGTFHIMAAMILATLLRLRRTTMTQMQR